MKLRKAGVWVSITKKSRIGGVFTGKPTKVRVAGVWKSDVSSITPYEAAVANIVLAGRWKLNEPSGNALDSISTHDGLWSSGPTTRGVTGPTSSLLGITSNANSHLGVAYGSWMAGPADGTPSYPSNGGIGVWFKTSINDGGIHTLVERRSLTLYLQSFILWLREDGHLQGLLYTGNQPYGSASSDTTPNTQILDGGVKTDGVWHRAWMTWSYNSTTNVTTGKLYIDGALVATNTSTGRLYSLSNFQGALDIASENDEGRKYKGDMADICFANAATPTAAQISAEYAAA